MPTLPPALITGLTQAMKALSQRQQVIAQNLANSETPGFKARETVSPNFSALLAAQGDGGPPKVARPGVTITSGMAALGARQPDGGSIIADRDTGETKPDGNNVVLEEQMLKMGQLQADYTAVTSIYRKQMGLLKTATTGHGGG
jgi:flagellar basal-body rod protein FlgB